jgi:hypothetical protein
LPGQQLHGPLPQAAQGHTLAIGGCTPSRGESVIGDQAIQDVELALLGKSEMQQRVVG